MTLRLLTCFKESSYSSYSSSYYYSENISWIRDSNSLLNFCIMYCSDCLFVFLVNCLLFSSFSLFANFSLVFRPSISKWSSIFCPYLFYYAISFDFFEICGWNVSLGCGLANLFLTSAYTCILLLLLFFLVSELLFFSSSLSS